MGGIGNACTLGANTGGGRVADCARQINSSEREAKAAAWYD